MAIISGFVSSLSHFSITYLSQNWFERVWKIGPAYGCFNVSDHANAKKLYFSGLGAKYVNMKFAAFIISSLAKKKRWVWFAKWFGNNQIKGVDKLFDNIVKDYEQIVVQYGFSNLHSWIESNGAPTNYLHRIAISFESRPILNTSWSSLPRSHALAA